MSYNILPNIIFLISILGILLIILGRLPEAAEQQETAGREPSAEAKLQKKGLPTLAASKIRVTAALITKKVWNFILEAKDLKPHAAAGYRIKKIFGGKLPALPGFKKSSGFSPVANIEIRDESYYLEIIKLQPRNLANYDALGKFYLDRESISDAKDIYLYAVNHEPANPDYQARLAYCYYSDKQFGKAAEHYQKSLALDSTQPKRYYNLSLSLEAAGDGEGALKALRQALELQPKNPKFLHSLQQMQEKE